MVLAAALAAVGCRSDPDGIVVDRDGQGALWYDATTAFGVDKTIVGVGETWSAGSVTLCKKHADERITVQSVEPVSVQGQVRLDGIGARMTHYAKANGSSDPDNALVGTMPGSPAGLQSPDGFLVESTCPNPRGPVGEIVVTMTKTGPQGGSLDGLRVLYTAGGRTHQLTLGFHFGLCGSDSFAVPCREER